MKSFSGPSWRPPCDRMWSFYDPLPFPPNNFTFEWQLKWKLCRVSDHPTKYILLNIGPWRYYLLNHPLITNPWSNYFLVEHLLCGKFFACNSPPPSCEYDPVLSFDDPSPPVIFWVTSPLPLRGSRNIWILPYMPWNFVDPFSFKMITIHHNIWSSVVYILLLETTRYNRLWWHDAILPHAYKHHLSDYLYSG